MNHRVVTLLAAVCFSALSGVQGTAAADSAGSISIDAGRTAEPISKYIYGQFIEHLGRCIYGGIWAEMLEDRKFYLTVGAEESPWKPIGSREGVSMVREGALVGDHVPKVVLAGDGTARGIVQGGLALRTAKRYVGRIWLAGRIASGAVQVSLVWGDGPRQRQTIVIHELSEDFAKTLLQFTAGGDTDDGRLEVASAGAGSFRVGAVSLMPEDNVQGMRADTLQLLRELDSPIYRWPGGNFVSGYNWKDGLGDADRRPPRKNPAWEGIEHHDFGIDEFLAFCRLLGTEPYIVVNSGLGDAGSAVEELQYVNGAADTPMGRLRAQNGHPAPYGVKFFGVGNEMYGKWQLGHMPLEAYVQKHNQFAQAMKTADPSVKLIAVGAVGPWSEGMLKQSADQMDLISEHFYCRAKPELIDHVRQISEAVRRKADAHRAYRQQLVSLRGKDIRIALDEWNFWYGTHLYGELGTRYFLRDALGIAAGLHELVRNSDLFFMANYAQTVNVIGCIKTTPAAAALETTGLVLKLYRRHFGVVPVAVAGCEPLDVAAAWTADRRTLTVALVNPTLEPWNLALQVRGAKLSGAGYRRQIAGQDPLAYNEPGQPARVAIEETPLEQVSHKLSVAPCSVTLYSLAVQ